MITLISDSLCKGIAKASSKLWIIDSTLDLGTVILHYSDVTWASQRPESPSCVFTPQRIRNAKSLFISWCHDIEDLHLCNLSFIPQSNSAHKGFYSSSMLRPLHYNDVIIGAMASKTIGVWIVCADQINHKSSASLTFAWGIHRGPVDFPHKELMTRKMFPFHDVIIIRNKDTFAFPLISQHLDLTGI